ncbi:MAG: ComF family protein [Pseudomonadales bacterium]
MPSVTRLARSGGIPWQSDHANWQANLTSARLPIRRRGVGAAVTIHAMQPFAHLLGRFFRHLLPGACLLCEQALPATAELDLCAFCRPALPWNQHACPQCAQPRAPGSTESACHHCLQRPPPFVRALAPLRYEGYVQPWIRRLKDNLGLVEGRLLGMLMADAAAQAYQPRDGALGAGRRPDLLVPVPLAPARLARRGHNQALTLALPVARRLGIPVLRHAAARRSGFGQQRGRSRAQRLEATADLFVCRQRWQQPRPCIGIVDDVITTGTTATALAQVLLAAGADEVHLIAAARTPRYR